MRLRNATEQEIVALSEDERLDTEICPSCGEAEVAEGIEEEGVAQQTRRCSGCWSEFDFDLPQREIVSARVPADWRIGDVAETSDLR